MVTMVIFLMKYNVADNFLLGVKVSGYNARKYWLKIHVRLCRTCITMKLNFYCKIIFANCLWREFFNCYYLFSWKCWKTIQCSNYNNIVYFSTRKLLSTFSSLHYNLSQSTMTPVKFSRWSLANKISWSVEILSLGQIKGKLFLYIFSEIISGRKYAVFHNKPWFETRIWFNSYIQLLNV